MAPDKTDKTDKTLAPTNGPEETPYQAAVREAVDMLRIATSADYDPYREMLTDRGSLFLFQDPEGFVRQARQHPIAHDAMRLVLADLIASRVMPPDAACDWLAAHLRGQAKRPNAKAGSKKDIKLHNAIWMVVRDLTGPGMKATRNDASNLQTSACDAVAEAMQRLGLEPQTFDGIKRIWLRFQRLHVGQKSK